MVEHDEDAIRAADYVVDMGPGAGEHGGEIVAQGTPEEIRRAPHSLTGAVPARRSAQIADPGQAHAADRAKRELQHRGRDAATT